ncbi:hypothetical protein [Poriferisphaera sp. WC338]|uniref:hypothetical protein n=1 Tax=Poriferisphaera sp. WC338 TaxID=3425129 RepID=UPI003D81AAA3
MRNDQVTLFSLPKAFTGHSGVIQRNAVRSWVHAGHPVILLGTDEGIAEMAEEVGATYIPDVAMSDLGTPILSSAFQLASAKATTPYLGYINGDILITQSFNLDVSKLGDDFLCVGRRTDVDIEWEVDFDDEHAVAKLWQIIADQGQLHPKTGIDYFIFPQESSLLKIPDFVVGRPGWDNWMCDRTWKLGIPMVCLTNHLTVGHQNHDYGHIKQYRGKAWDNPETDKNRALQDGVHRDLEDCTWRVNETGEILPRYRQLARMHSRLARFGMQGIVIRCLHGLRCGVALLQSQLYADVLLTVKQSRSPESAKTQPAS